MKLSCIKNYLLEGFTLVERVIEKNTVLPILQNVLIKTEKNKLILSATNLEIGIQVTIAAKISEEGSLTVPAKVFSSFLSSLPDEKISLQTKGTTVTVSSDLHRATILGTDVKDFPIIPTITDGFSFVIPAEVFFSALSSINFLTAQGDLRPELGGVFCSFEKETIRMAATDSFRLGERTIKISEQKNTIKCIIPTKTVSELIRVFGGMKEEISLCISANQFMVKTTEKELISRLIEGKYPDYTAIIPTSFTTTVRVKKEDFFQTLRAASIFAGKNHDVKLSISPEEKKCIIESQNNDIGEHKGHFPCEGNGKTLKVLCNYQYFLEILAKLEDEYISLEGNGENDPLVLKNTTKSGTVYVVMPLRAY